MVSQNTTPLSENEIISVRNTEYFKGDTVRVRSYSGAMLERRVWAVTDDAVFVCAQHVWEALISGIEAAAPVGFPFSDITVGK